MVVNNFKINKKFLKYKKFKDIRNKKIDLKDVSNQDFLLKNQDIKVNFNKKFNVILRKLRLRRSKTGGRNNFGRITVRHRGGGLKRLYFYVDYKKHFSHLPFIVLKKKRSFFFSSYIGLVLYSNNYFSYILLNNNINIGDIYVNGDNVIFKMIKKDKKKLYPGVYSTLLRNIDIGVLINNVELYKGCGSIFGRAAGSYCQLLNNFSFYGNRVIIKLKSSMEYLLNCNNYASIGTVSNVNHHFKNYKKAGVKRLLGRRSKVRGVAMNPIDHPHGGGEGKTSGGRPSVSPSGKLTKGVKTRKKNKSTSKWIILKKDKKVKGKGKNRR